MQLDLTEEEAAALLSLLNRAIDRDRYPLSPRIRVLRGIRAKLPGAPPQPPSARPAAPEERSPGRAPRAGRPRRWTTCSASNEVMSNPVPGAAPVSS